MVPIPQSPAEADPVLGLPGVPPMQPISSWYAALWSNEALPHPAGITGSHTLSTVKQDGSFSLDFDDPFHSGDPFIYSGVTGSSMPTEDKTPATAKDRRQIVDNATRSARDTSHPSTMDPPYTKCKVRFKAGLSFPHFLPETNTIDNQGDMLFTVTVKNKIQGCTFQVRSDAIRLASKAWANYLPNPYVSGAFKLSFTVEDSMYDPEMIGLMLKLAHHQYDNIPKDHNFTLEQLAILARWCHLHGVRSLFQPYLIGWLNPWVLKRRQVVSHEILLQIAGDLGEADLYHDIVQFYAEISEGCNDQLFVRMNHARFNLDETNIRGETLDYIRAVRRQYRDLIILIWKTGIETLSSNPPPCPAGDEAECTKKAASLMLDEAESISQSVKDLLDQVHWIETTRYADYHGEATTNSDCVLRTQNLYKEAFMTIRQHQCDTSEDWVLPHMWASPDLMFPYDNL